MNKSVARLMVLLIVAGSALSPAAAQPVVAAVALTVTPLTWNVIGLDSNNPATGPNRFPVGARVCATGSTAAGAVQADFTWDSVNPDITLRPGSLASVTLGAIAAGSCADAYFEVEVNKTVVPSPYDTTRRYHITATDTVSGATASTPRPRELFVEHLISQNRNGVTSIKLNGTAIPAGGSMTLVVGNTYTIELAGYTATQGYNQLEAFINFPNTIFQTLGVSTTYSADTSAYVTSPDDQLYADACLWENDPNSPNYRTCVGEDAKAGGTVVTTYTVRIIAGAGSSQTLNSLLYDFSGSSFHYNADYGVGFRTANIVGPGSVTMTKAFTPKAIAPGGTAQLSFRVSNPTTETFTGVNFTDTFPTGMAVAATPAVAYSGCGPGAFSPVPLAGAGSVSFENGTLGPNGVCTATVTVTAPAGTYPNTTGHLFVNTSIDTGNVGQDTLVAAAGPVCSPGQTLATWTMPAAGQGSGGPPPPYTTRAANVTTATASTSAGMTNSIESGQGNPANAWAGKGFPKTGVPGGDGEPSFEFALDTSKYSGVGVSLDFERDTNWGGGASDTPTMYVYSSTTGLAGSFSLIGTTSSLTDVWQSTGNLLAAATGSGTTYFRINARGSNSVTSSQLYLDNIRFTGCGLPVPSPAISKSFASDPIVRGATSSLGFTISNTEPGSQALTGVAFSDVLPAGLSVADASSSQCNGTLTTTASTRTIALTGGQLGAGLSCSFSVTVTGTTEGQYDNVTGYVSSTQSGTSTSYATDSLTVIAPPALGKAFSPTSIRTGDTSTLAFTITNPNRLVALSGIGLTDALPAGVTVATTGPTSTCGGSLTTTSPDAISFAGGSLGANATCTFSVTVTGTTAGSKANTTTAVTSAEGGPGNVATATLVVIDPVAALDLVKQVSADGVSWFKFIGVPVGGDVYYRFSAYNGGDIPFTSITVNDPAPVACTWSGTAYPPLAPGETATCVTGPIQAVVGSHPNTATATGVHATGSTDSTPSTATYATTALSINKTAERAWFTAVLEELRYEIVVTNSGFAPLPGPISITDDKASDEACPSVTTVGDLDDYLDPGEAVTCTATYTVQASDMTAGFVTNVASATVAGVSSGTSTATVGLAALTISKTADPTSTSTTGPISYLITVVNTGAYDLTGVVLTDPLTAGATLVSGDAIDPGVLNVGETWTYEATYTVVQADIDSGAPIVNTATVDTDQTVAKEATASTTIQQAPALSLAKTATPATYDSVGDVIAYSYLVTNTGNVALGGPFTVDDDQATDEACPATASLAPGASITCTATDTITQADLDAGSVTNVASASGGGATSPTDTETVTAVQGPALSLAKTATPATYDSVGDVIAYSYLVTNTGNVALGGPFTVDDDQATDEACPATASLAPGASITCTATDTITQADLDAGSVTNTASASGGGATSPTDSETVTAVQGPALSLAKTATPATYDSVGDVIAYSYLVTNTGNVALAGPVIVTDDKATVTCPAGGLAAGAAMTCTASYTITQADLDAGSVTNTATASANGTDSNEDTETVTAVGSPALTLAKSGTFDAGADGLADPGELIAYSFLVTNTGNVTLHTVTVTDPLAGLSATTCPATTLAAGAAMTCTATYAVTQADIDAGSVANTATADSLESGPDSDTLDIPIVGVPGLSITKAITSGAVYRAVGNVIAYEYRILNSGNVTLDGPITVTDDRTSVTCPAVSGLAPGASMTCTSTYVITQADLDLGSVTNTASATADLGAVTVSSAVVSVGARAAGVTPTVPPSSSIDGPQASGPGPDATWAVLLLVLASLLLVAVDARARTRRPTRR